MVAVETSVCVGGVFSTCRKPASWSWFPLNVDNFALNASALYRFVVLHLAQLSSGSKKLLSVGSSRTIKTQHLVTHLNIYSGLHSCWCLLAVVAHLYLSGLMFPELCPLGSDVLSMLCCWLVGYPVGKLEEITFLFLAIFKGSTEFHTFQSLFTWQKRTMLLVFTLFSQLQMFLYTDAQRMPRISKHEWQRHVCCMCLWAAWCILLWLWAFHLVCNETLRCTWIQCEIVLCLS